MAAITFKTAAKKSKVIFKYMFSKTNPKKRNPRPMNINDMLFNFDICKKILKI